MLNKIRWMNMLMLENSITMRVKTMKNGLTQPDLIPLGDDVEVAI